MPRIKSKTSPGAIRSLRIDVDAHRNVSPERRSDGCSDGGDGSGSVARFDQELRTISTAQTE
jgi:hypothetical protein